MKFIINKDGTLKTKTDEGTSPEFILSHDSINSNEEFKTGIIDHDPLSSRVGFLSPETGSIVRPDTDSDDCDDDNCDDDEGQKPRI